MRRNYAAQASDSSPEGGIVEWNRSGPSAWARAHLGALGNERELARAGDRLGPIARAELLEDVRHVLFDGVERDRKLLTDLPIAPTPREQPQDLQLALT